MCVCVCVYFFFFLVDSCGMQGSNLCAPAVEAWSPNHWAADEFPRLIFLI